MSDEPDLILKTEPRVVMGRYELPLARLENVKFPAFDVKIDLGVPPGEVWLIAGPEPEIVKVGEGDASP